MIKWKETGKLTKATVRVKTTATWGSVYEVFSTQPPPPPSRPGQQGDLHYSGSFFGPCPDLIQKVDADNSHSCRVLFTVFRGHRHQTV